MIARKTEVWEAIYKKGGKHCEIRVKCQKYAENKKKVEILTQENFQKKKSAEKGDSHTPGKNFCVLDILSCDWFNNWYIIVFNQSANSSHKTHLCFGHPEMWLV